MLKRILYPFIIVCCFIVLIIFLKNNFTLPVSHKDEFRDFRKAEIRGRVILFDEGRGLIVKVDNRDTLYSFAAETLIYSNKSYSDPICRLGDSLIKHHDSDTFTIKRESDVFVYVLPNEK